VKIGSCCLIYILPNEILSHPPISQYKLLHHSSTMAHISYEEKGSSIIKSNGNKIKFKLSVNLWLQDQS
jgi:hypothetical protein